MERSPVFQELRELLSYWQWKMKKKFEGNDRARMMVRIRDRFTCQNCGNIRDPLEAKRTKKRLFDVHHVGGICGKGREYSFDSVRDIWKMITLCHKCHFLRADHTVQIRCSIS